VIYGSRAITHSPEIVKIVLGIRSRTRPSIREAIFIFCSQEMYKVHCAFYTMILVNVSVILSISSSSSSLCSSSLSSLSSPSAPTVVEAVGVANELTMTAEQRKTTYYHLPGQWAENPLLVDEGHSSQVDSRFVVAAYEDGRLHCGAASV
jgi:hypothetical protein